MNSHKNPQKGFTILVAVVTAGILLIIAMSIGGIALKEQVLSTANKESQIAFYAADTGMECALYWDQSSRTALDGAFKPDTDASNPEIIVDQTTMPSIRCNGADISLELEADTGNYSYTFMITRIPVGTGGTTCAVVKIFKDTSVDPVETHIYSYGYNTCDASLTRLERGIEGHY